MHILATFSAGDLVLYKRVCIIRCGLKEADMNSRLFDRFQNEMDWTFLYIYT